MTLTTATFLHNVARVRDLGDECLGKEALDRLLRLAERCVALEAILGADDPGHDVTAAVCSPTQDRTKAVWNFARMGRAVLATVGPFEEGVCRVCGCTETTACSVPVERLVAWNADDEPQLARGFGACSWIEGSKRTLCSRPECLSAGLASGQVVMPPLVDAPAAVARFLPEGVEFEPLPPFDGTIERECRPVADMAGSDVTPGHDDHYDHASDEFPGLSRSSCAR